MKRFFSSRWAAIIVAAIIPLLFSRILFLFPFVLVPFGILALSRGLGTAFAGVGLFLLLNTGLEFLLAGDLSLPPSVFLLEGLLFGLYASAAVFVARLGPGRTIYRSVLAAVLLSFFSWHIALAIFGEPSVAGLLEAQVQAAIDQALAILESDSYQYTLLKDELSWERVVAYARLFASHGGLFAASFLLLGITVRFSSLFASRRLGAPYALRLRMRALAPLFKPPSYFIWLLSGSLACLLLANVLEWGPEAGLFVRALGLVGANAGVLAIIMYSYAGFGVMQFTMARFALPRLLQIFLVFIVFMLVMNMATAPFAIAVFALIGASETWLPLRAAIKREPPSTPEV